MVASIKVVGSLDVKPPLVAGSVAAGSSVVAGSVAAGSSVAAGGWVAGAAPPHAARIMLARTSKLSKANNLRIFLLLTKFERFIENVLNSDRNNYPCSGTTTSFRTNTCYKNLSAKKQATKWPGRISRNSGRVSAQTGSAIGQRVRNRQPEGGFAGEGTSPTRMVRFRFASATGSGMGTADN